MTANDKWTYISGLRTQPKLPHCAQCNRIFLKHYWRMNLFQDEIGDSKYL